MDIRSITAPVIADRSAWEEFIEALTDTVPNIERDISLLKNDPGNRELISSLFRSIHNVKGDAALCKVELAVAIAHPIETVLARFRSDEIPFSDMLVEAILLAFDRLELAVEAVFSGKSIDNLHLVALIQGLESLAAAPADEIDDRAFEVIERVTGFRPTSQSTAQVRGGSSLPARKTTAQVKEDLQFFHSLADQLESRSLLFKGRTLRLLRLAMETNLARDNPVDPQQLEAAVYMHDIGMMFLPESVWLKLGRMTEEEKKILHAHPKYASGLLSRMHGWEEAAEMVAQHHEMPDGRGYPQSIPAQKISDGAKILAIVDAFEAVMLKHINRGKNRSVLRAIAEINACDNQFAPEWIEPFNQVIRRTLEA